jgi:hypothetical protein
MSDDNASAGRSGEAGLDPLFRLAVAEAFARDRHRQLIDELARAEAIFAQVASKKEWVDNWDNPAEFKAFEKEGGCFGSGSRITIEREDDSGLRLLIEDSSGDCAQITLSAEQVAALRLWLTP